MLQNTTMCYYNSRELGLFNKLRQRLLQFTIAWLLQFWTTVIIIYDRYYNLPRLLLQFTTGITIHDRTRSNQMYKQRRKRFTFNKLKGKKWS